MNTIIIITIAVYLLGMIAIGAAYSKKNDSAGEFYLGGRKLGFLVTAMSAEASDMSSWLLMGLPGVALVAGLAEASWTAIGLALGTYINWLIVSKRIRNYSSTLGSFTIPDFFSKRFRDKKGILALASALIIIIFFVPYTASGFSACGKLFNSFFGVPYVTAMIISAAVIVIYTTLGGFFAASVTDLVQSVVMTIALFVVIGFGISYAGGWDAVNQHAQSLPGYLGLTSTHAAGSISEMIAGEAGSKPYGALTIASTLAWGLGYFGMPHILLRFMAIRNPKELKVSRRIASIWVVISMAASILIGVIGSAILSKGGVLDSFSDPERIIVQISKTISENGALFAILAGIILAGILAATMSTADSQLLAASSSVSQDLLRGVFKMKISEKTAMIIARVSVIVIAAVGVVIALNENSSVFKVVSFAWAGFGAAFGPVVLFGLFWKRTTKEGALAGIIAGGAGVFVWKFVIAKLGGVFAIYELLPAFIFACIAILVVSLISKEPDTETVKEFESVKSM